MGSSETIHRRRLVSPDEIGHLFARIDDPQEAIYPGLALIVISGERTIALRRVNYFEDLEFIGRFQPPPDHGSAPAVKELSVNGKALEKLAEFFKGEGEALVVTDWQAKERQLVSAGEPVAGLGLASLKKTWVNITSPRDGMVMALPGRQWNGGIQTGPLFSMRYFDNGSAPVNPLQHMAEFFERYERVLEKDVRETTKWAVLWGIGAAVLAVLALASGIYRTLLVGAAICAVWGVRNYNKRNNWSGILDRFRKKMHANGA
jgi:uncharacterized membrane protein